MIQFRICLRFNDFPNISKYDAEEQKKTIKVTMPGTMSNMGYLSTQEQVTPKRNVPYSQISNSSENFMPVLVISKFK